MCKKIANSYFVTVLLWAANYTQSVWKWGVTQNDTNVWYTFLTPRWHLDLNGFNLKKYVNSYSIQVFLKVKTVQRWMWDRMLKTSFSNALGIYTFTVLYFAYFLQAQFLQNFESDWYLNRPVLYIAHEQLIFLTGIDALNQHKFAQHTAHETHYDF